MNLLTLNRTLGTLSVCIDKTVGNKYWQQIVGLTTLHKLIILCKQIIRWR